MSNIELLIKEIESNCKELNEQYQKYKKIIIDLCNAFPNDKGNVMFISYYPNSYNGRKICFNAGYKEHKDLKSMIIALITSNKMEQFINYLSKVALPVYKSNQHIDNFHF